MVSVQISIVIFIILSIISVSVILSIVSISYPTPYKTKTTSCTATSSATIIFCFLEPFVCYLYSSLLFHVARFFAITALHLSFPISRGPKVWCRRWGCVIGHPFRRHGSCGIVLYGRNWYLSWCNLSLFSSFGICFQFYKNWLTVHILRVHHNR